MTMMTTLSNPLLLTREAPLGRAIDAAYDPALLTDDADESCWTPLQLAARAGQVDRVRELIAQDASAVNDLPRGYYGQTALQTACIRGHEDVVRLLLSAGADVDFCGGNNMQRTALQFACGQGNEKVVDLLLEKRAQVNLTTAVSGGGRSVNTGHARRISVVNRYNGRTALQAAAEGGHIGIVTKLLDLGADVNAPPSPTNGKTALQAAVEYGLADTVQLLLGRGADVNAAPARYGGFTALQAACLQGNMELLEVLIAAGADIHGLGGSYGDATAMHAAAETGQADVIRRLAELGADVNAVTRGGQTAIQTASRKGHEWAVAVLRELGALGRTTGGIGLFKYNYR